MPGGRLAIGQFFADCAGYPIARWRFKKSLRRIGTMATIRYTFADGHSEEVEVTEEFKREYEFLLVREQALHKEQRIRGFEQQSVCNAAA